MNQSSLLPDGCPPEDAKPASGLMYRCAEQDPPSAADFLSWRELNPGKNCPTGTTECHACSISLFGSMDGIKQVINRVPRLQKMKIAQGELNSNLGVMENASSKNKKNTSHCDWWPPQNSQPWDVFKIIKA
jgi:hypothetical protein